MITVVLLGLLAVLPIGFRIATVILLFMILQEVSR